MAGIIVSHKQKFLLGFIYTLLESSRSALEHSGVGVVEFVPYIKIL